LKLSSDGDDSCSKKCKEGYGGVWQSLQLVGRFCDVAFGRKLASVAVKMFSHLIQFENEFYKFCSFNAIFKDNAATKYINDRHKKVYSRQF
jgi:hypothetical protein